MYPTGSSHSYRCAYMLCCHLSHGYPHLCKPALWPACRTPELQIMNATSHENPCPYPMNVFHCPRRPKYEWVTRLMVSKPEPVAPLEITTDEEYYFVSKPSDIVQGMFAMTRLQGATGDDTRCPSSANAFHSWVTERRSGQDNAVRVSGTFYRISGRRRSFVVNHGWLG